MKKKIKIYTDGACKNNGKKNATAGIGIHFPKKEISDVSRVLRKKKVTNQIAELYAIYFTLKLVYIYDLLNKYKKIVIYTDSQYSIKSLTEWIEAWLKNNWKSSKGGKVVNKNIIEKIYNFIKGKNIYLKHVKSHTKKTDKHSLGNAEADRLATEAIK